eukprot:7327026-Prymnesium_polylepis.1
MRGLRVHLHDSRLLGARDNVPSRREAAQLRASSFRCRDSRSVAVFPLLGDLVSPPAGTDKVCGRVGDRILTTWPAHLPADCIQ